MNTSITKRIVTKALTEIIEGAWHVGARGQRGAERLLMSEQRRPLRLYTAMQSIEATLEALVESVAARLGIDMQEVLAPIVAARV